MGGIVIPYNDIYPSIEDGVFIAETAVIIGDVTIGRNSNIWYGCVLRGDVNRIEVGEDTNIQDGTIVHVASDDNPMSESGIPTIIGNRVTIGHLALLHACSIADESLVGMKSCVMDGAYIASNSILAAGAVLSPNKRTESGQLWSGLPARYQRDLKAKELELIAWSWQHYLQLANNYKV